MSTNEPLRLLGAGDPQPVEMLRPAGASPFFLTCEHAGRALPRKLGDLGLPESELSRHIGWDIGAAGVARDLSERLDATCVLQRYSRLVVDCNRWPHAPDFIVEVSESTEVPGNRDVAPAEIAARTEEIYLPYHETIRAALDQRDRDGRLTVFVSVHSCTPVYHGVRRPWHVGVLYEHDERLARVILGLLETEEHERGKLMVGDNEPYFLDSGRDYSVPVHGHGRGHLHVEFEIRQDLIGTAAQQAEWGARLARVLPEALGRLKESGAL